MSHCMWGIKMCELHKATKCILCKIKSKCLCLIYYLPFKLFICFLKIGPNLRLFQISGPYKKVLKLIIWA